MPRGEISGNEKKMGSVKKFLRSLFMFVVIPGTVYLLFLLVRPASFGRVSMVGMLITQSYINTIIAWGLTFSMTAGNLDLSIGAQISLCTIVGCLLSQQYGMVGLIAGCVGTSLFVGFIKVLIMRVIQTFSTVISIAYALILASVGGVIAGNKVLVINTADATLGRFPYNLILFLILGASIFYLQSIASTALMQGQLVETINLRNRLVFLSLMFKVKPLSLRLFTVVCGITIFKLRHRDID